jgi:hypothetical protein
MNTESFSSEAFFTDAFSSEAFAIDGGTPPTPTPAVRKRRWLPLVMG